MKEMRSNHAPVPLHMINSSTTIAITRIGKGGGNTHECDTNINFSQLCAFNMQSISLHISSFSSASPVILKLTDMISTAMIPISPFDPSIPSSKFNSAKKFL